MPTTFPVSDVPGAEKPPALLDFASARERAGGRAIVAAGGPASVVDGPVLPALVRAADVAFNEHRPLVLSPDDVWFTILQGVAAHVALQPEALRSRFVAHEGRRTVEIRRDDLAPEADPPGSWATVPSEILAQVLDLSGPTARALRVELSTTDRNARVAMDVALLDALQSYFSYSVSSLCGIPAITLLGKPGDWATLVQSAAALEGLGLDGWLGPLREVLVEMHRAASGAADRSFWQALYKPEHFSGGDLVVGWINVLFPYALDGRSLRDVEPFLPRNLPEGPDPEASWMPEGASVLKPSGFPSSLARAPFTWKLRHEERPMDLVAGHVGVGFDPTTGAVAPSFGWWIAPRAAERAFLVQNPTPEHCSLSPRSGATLRDLASIGREGAGYGAVDVSLIGCRDLTSLEGIASLRALDRLMLMECNAVSSLAPLAGLPAVRSVFVSQCAEVTDLAALSTLTTLESVSVMRCPKARGIAAIAALPNLREATLWGFPDIPERFQRNVTKLEEVRALQAWLREHPEA